MESKTIATRLTRIGALLLVLAALPHCRNNTPPALSPEGDAAMRSEDSSSVSFPQMAPSGEALEFPAALIEGTLALSDGCLRVNAPDGGTSHLIVWPPHVTLEASRGSVRVMDRNSGAEARVGETVRLGGGEISSAAPAFQQLGTPPPSGCPGPYWLASGIVR